MTTIKAIGFDYGGVIAGSGSLGTEFNAKICALLGIDENRFKDHYFSISHLIHLGEMATWREFWTIFLEKLGRPEKLEQIMVISDEASKQLEVIDEQMVDLVDKIRENGYKVGLLSNNTLENGNRLRAAGLDKHFDVFHISAETKLMKPDPKTFRLFADALGVKPEELVFIDDAEKSLSTARECGFTPILFRSREQLENELRALRILV